MPPLYKHHISLPSDINKHHISLPSEINKRYGVFSDKYGRYIHNITHVSVQQASKHTTAIQQAPLSLFPFCQPSVVDVNVSQLECYMKDGTMAHTS